MTTLGSSILTSLGAGSGIDTNALVSNLVSATRDPKQKAITDKQSLNNARISAVSSAVSSLNTFADALNNVLSGKDYTGTPASNDTGVATVSLLSGGTPAGLPVQMAVERLASARVLATSSQTGATASSSVGTGTITITTSAGKTVTIDPSTLSGNSYTNLATAINNAGIGVTARVVADANGARLVFKGETGASNDFSIAVSSGATGALAGFAWNGTDSATIASTSAAQNARITLDGVTQEFASNTIDTAIDHLRIELGKETEADKTVTLSMSQPTATMADLLKEYVDAYNTLMTALNTATAKGKDWSSAGVLNGVAGIRDMKNQLAAIMSTDLTSSGTYRRLSDIGISTNRDGTLKLDSTALTKALAADPEAVTKMVNPAVSTAANPGLAKVMDTVRDKIEQKDGPLKLLEQRYKSMADDFTKQLDTLDEQMTDYQAQLTRVYTAMATRLNALKGTESYLKQQIDVWNKSDN